MMAEDMLAAMRRMESAQGQMQAELSSVRAGTTGLSPEQMDKIHQLIALLQNSREIHPLIDNGVTEALRSIESKIDEQARMNDKIYVTVERVNRKQGQLFLVVCIPVAALLAAAGVIAYHVLERPFTATIHVHGWEGKHHHPLDGAGVIELTLGDKTERAGINRQGEAIFKKLPPAHEGRAARVALVDTGHEPYFLLDSVVRLERDETSEVRVTLRGLDRLEGYIQDGDAGIAGATVRVAGLVARTDGRGYFSLAIPPGKQRRYQEVEISKEGYAPCRYAEMPMARQEDRPFRVDLSRYRINDK
jgi:hypothetical protein